MQENEATSGPGTGWKEIFLGGSREAEQRLFQEVLPKLDEIQQAVAARQGAPIRRGFHNKGTPFRIEFIVGDDLPEHLRVGLFVPGASYQGFGRFSRSQSLHKPDASLDQRGFAFRIETPDGPQDFTISNTPVSFAEDPITFLIGGKIFATTSKPMTPVKLIAAFGFRKGLRIVHDVTSSPDRSYSFTSQRYWTRVAFQIGDAAVRFTVVPVPDEPVKVAGRGPAMLTDALTEELKSGPRRFTLNAQHFVNEQETPIENSNREWPETIAPLVRMGEIVLPKQDLKSGEIRALTERVEKAEAFSPWNTKHLHPLGSMNRARLEVYDRSAQARGGCPLHR